MRCSAPVKPSYDKREWKFFTIVGWKMLGTISGKLLSNRKVDKTQKCSGWKIIYCKIAESRILSCSTFVMGYDSLGSLLDRWGKVYLINQEDASEANFWEVGFQFGAYWICEGRPCDQVFRGIFLSWWAKSAKTKEEEGRGAAMGPF